MKQKITILALLFTILTFAQTTVHNTKVKLKNVNTGVVSDSLLVIAPNDEIRKIPRSVFLQGVEVDLSDYYTQTEISNLLGNYAIGDHTVDTNTQLSETQVDAFTANNGYLTSLPSNINADKIADGSVSNDEFQYINSLTSNAQSQLNTNSDNINLLDEATIARKNENNNFTEKQRIVAKSNEDNVSVFSDAHLKLKANSTPTNNIGITSIALSTSSAENYGITLNGARKGTTGAPSFSIRTHNNEDVGIERFVINTNGDFDFKDGDLKTNGSLTGTEFKTTNWTFKQVGNNIELQFNGATKMRFKSDGTIEATDFKIGL